MRTFLINTFIATAGACLACFLLSAVFWMDFQISGPLPRVVEGSDTPTSGQASVLEPFQWHERVHAQSARFGFVYIPAVTILLIAGVGVFSKSWRWTWLVAVIALSPAAIWTGVVVSVNLGTAILGGLVYLFVGAAFATAISWYRSSRQT